MSHAPRPCPVTSRLIWIQSRPSVMISSLLSVVAPPPCIVVHTRIPPSTLCVASATFHFILRSRFPCTSAFTHYIHLFLCPGLDRHGHPPCSDVNEFGAHCDSQSALDAQVLY
ncbi:hypothetical protein C8T65DRAFT_174005 [Cerioporus squamosus]|nr:hypothetical protein C8T65DRAFT_174005 [Cerioporus squamosus]